MRRGLEPCLAIASILVLAGAHALDAQVIWAFDPNNIRDVWEFNWRTQCMELHRYFLDVPGKYATIRVGECRGTTSGSGSPQGGASTGSPGGGGPGSAK